MQKRIIIGIGVLFLLATLLGVIGGLIANNLELPPKHTAATKQSASPESKESNKNQEKHMVTDLKLTPDEYINWYNSMMRKASHDRSLDIDTSDPSISASGEITYNLHHGLELTLSPATNGKLKGIILYARPQNQEEVLRMVICQRVLMEAVFPNQNGDAGLKTASLNNAMRNLGLIEKDMPPTKLLNRQFQQYKYTTKVEYAKMFTAGTDDGGLVLLIAAKDAS